LNRADDIWTVTKNDTTFKADANTIHAVLEQTTNMTPLRIAALNKERWEELELTPDKGTVVRYYSGKKTLADFSIGKYEYYEKMQSGQQRGDMSTYVRENDGETVYAVRGFLKTLFRANSDYYRNHAFYPPINKEDITEVTYITPDSLNLNYKLTKESDGWIINGMSVDSAAVVTFFNKIVRASSGRFVTAIPDNIYPETCTIKGNNMAAIEVRLYPAEGGFIITSTYDDDGIFFDKDGTMRNRYLSIINRQ
ncbi:MAG: DUF4340 domain-containing protein, partial [Bacteroidales bacterium]|nr:DUF4340 domain-containing protein [Bacteroidales bacterium]